ncbi:MAG: bifunctional DNA-formamidopyrimidine glycosylase/DNA-(apurinic or apyrimidinic site) lyase [Candidatus Pacebacteria bacterium]|nr:bifunctional DNA-formamidopyrimidine glycosylase/DNA-(apurinic or apyrimidinic site) lyase [Candidatus Paceibacterota bacterium]
MPELPEVENLRLGLERSILGQKIIKIKVNKPKLVSGNGTKRAASAQKVSEFEQGLTGEKFIAVERRAKNLLFKLSHGKLFLVHLKMSGQFVYQGKGSKKLIEGGHPIELSETELPNKHTHVIFTLQKGTLFYNDTRMFGYLLYYPNLKTFEAKNHFGVYGAEPLQKEFTYKYFSEALKNKKGKIKAVLMDQKIVTGLGNIYADESLFESGIHPDRTPSSLSPLEIKKLHTAIIRILKKAVKVGGSSVATYRLLDDTRGNYAREHKVYGKDGENCPNCGHKLVKTIVGGRTTIFCPSCQK